MSYMDYRLASTLLIASFALGRMGAEEPIRIIAHRGGVVDQHRPENSTSAVEEGIRRGYWMLEMDVQESKDGHLVVHHDDNFVKLYGVHKTAAELTWDEIRQFHAVEDGSRPLEFSEYAALCKGKVQLMIDTKEPSHPPAFYDRWSALCVRTDCWMAHTSSEPRKPARGSRASPG